jgi:hypothetical protein
LLTPVSLRSDPRKRYVKRKSLKSFSVIFASLLTMSFCVVFQTQAAIMSGVRIQVLDSLGNASNDCSLALDSNGSPYISYCDIKKRVI